jgi:hypothetical protein
MRSSSSKSAWRTASARAARSGHRRTHQCRSQARPPPVGPGLRTLSKVSFGARVHHMKRCPRYLPTPSAVLCFMVTQWIMRNAKEKSEVGDKAFRIAGATVRSFAQSGKKLLERFLCCLEAQAAKGVHARTEATAFSLIPIGATSCEYAFESEPVQPRCLCGVRVGGLSGVGHERSSR